MSSGVRLTGRSGLEGVPEGITAQTVVYVREFSRATRDKYRADVPVDEGELQGSIDEHLSDTGLSSMIGSSGTDHAVHVEFGTEDTPSKPALFPAFQANARKFRKNVRDLLKGSEFRLRTRMKRGKRTVST